MHARSELFSVRANQTILWIPVSISSSLKFISESLSFIGFEGFFFVLTLFFCLFVLILVNKQNVF